MLLSPVFCLDYLVAEFLVSLKKIKEISPIALKLAAYIYTTLENIQTGLDGCFSVWFSPSQMQLLADLITEEQLKSHQVEIMSHWYSSVGKSHTCITCNVYGTHPSALAVKSHGPLSRWHSDEAFPGKTPYMYSKGWCGTQNDGRVCIALC